MPFGWNRVRGFTHSRSAGLSEPKGKRTCSIEVQDVKLGVTDMYRSMNNGTNGQLPSLAFLACTCSVAQAQAQAQEQERVVVGFEIRLPLGRANVPVLALTGSAGMGAVQATTPVSVLRASTVCRRPCRMKWVSDIALLQRGAKCRTVAGISCRSRDQMAWQLWFGIIDPSEPIEI